MPKFSIASQRMVVGGNNVTPEHGVVVDPPTAVAIGEITGTSARVAIPTTGMADSDVYDIHIGSDAHIAYGDASVVATTSDHAWKAGQYQRTIPGSDPSTHVAFILAT